MNEDSRSQGLDSWECVLRVHILSWVLRRRSWGNPLFQCVFPSFKVLSIRESQSSPLWELSMPGAGQAWNVGSSPTILYARPQTSTQGPESLGNGSVPSANTCKHSIAEDMYTQTGSVKDDQGADEWVKEKTHFWILPWEPGNGYDELNYRCEIPSTFWWWRERVML